MPRPSASATASRFAAHWVADALVADDALDFSSVMALLDASPKSLAGAPESVSERVALRCLQELSAAATTGDGSTASHAPAEMLRVDITRSCEDLLLQIIGEVRTSGSLRKDMLRAFSQDIQNFICIKKPRLPETYFKLLREVDQEIACMDLPSPVEQNGDNEHGVDNLTNLVNQTCKENILKESVEPTSDLQQGCISDTVIPQVDSSKAHMSSPQHDSGEKANQDFAYEGTSIQSVENDSVHKGLALQVDSVFALHDKTSEENYLSEQTNAKRTTDVQKLSCSITVPVPPGGGDGRRQISNKETLANTVVETSHVHSLDDSLSGSADKMSFCIKDQGTNSSPSGCSEKDLCIKCGKDGQLLKCNSCLLAAHKSCFGPSVSSEDSGEFCCPVCFYTKATEAYKEAKKTYCEARKNLAAFLGSQQLVSQHDEQVPEVLPRASPSKALLNGYNSVKQKNSHQIETHRLACSDEKADQQKKKQKTYATTDTCHEEAVTGKTPSVQNSGVEPMNKHSVLQNISKQVQDAQKEQEVENAEAREEAGNKNSCDGTRNTSHERCVSSATNQEVEADKGDGLTNCNQSENSAETEAISLSDSGQQSLPPLHNTRQQKARLQERDTLASCNSGNAVGQQGQHTPSPSSKRNNAYVINRLSGPVMPTGRRSKISWTDEEEAALREAMEKFNPRDNGPIPWAQMLEYRRDVFHRVRIPCDLRFKWRNMMKKAGS